MNYGSYSGAMNYGSYGPPPAGHVFMDSDPFSAAAERRSGYVWKNAGSMENIHEVAEQYAYADQTSDALLQKAKLRLPGMRRRLNAHALLLAVVIPYALFVFVFSVVSLRLHYEAPLIADLVVFVAFILVMAVGLIALGKIKSRTMGYITNEPTWTIFLAITLFLAFLMAIGLGEWVFEMHFRPYWDLGNLNNFTNVNPQYIRGQMVMDAGHISFVPGTRLDLSRSMGFRNGDVYCVAPIVFGETKMDTYDFWAVGTNCCSGNSADFHCSNFNNERANGAMRLVGGQSDKERPFYRLAVQQAEAAYEMQAVHPLFFHWVAFPEQEMEKYWLDGRKAFASGLVSAFVMQCFFVACAAVAFAKMGY